MYLIFSGFYTLLMHFITFSFSGHQEYDVDITNKQRFTTKHHRRCQVIHSNLSLLEKGEIVQWNRLAKHTGSTAEQSGIRENAHDRRLQVCGTSI